MGGYSGASASAASTVSEKVIAKHSTTIGDYTTPTSILASSHENIIAEEHASTNDVTNYTSTLIRAGLLCNANSALVGKYISQIILRLEKTGSPTGTATAVVRNSSDTIVFTIGTLDVSTLTTSPVDKTFKHATDDYKIASGDRISLEYSGSDGSNRLEIGRHSSGSYDGTDTHYFTYNGSYSEITAQDPYFKITNPNGTADNLKDADTGTTWDSVSEANSFCTCDMGSNKNIVGIAIHKHANTTETEITIETSTDAISWTKKRTVTVSDLSAGAWEFRRIPATLARYLRIFGNSGSSLVLAINEIKVLTKTDSELISDHSHLDISSTDTGLNDDGS